MFIMIDDAYRGLKRLVDSVSQDYARIQYIQNKKFTLNQNKIKCKSNRKHKKINYKKRRIIGGNAANVAVK